MEELPLLRDIAIALSLAFAGGLAARLCHLSVIPPIHLTHVPRIMHRPERPAAAPLGDAQRTVQRVAGIDSKS